MDHSSPAFRPRNNGGPSREKTSNKLPSQEPPDTPSPVPEQESSRTPLGIEVVVRHYKSEEKIAGFGTIYREGHSSFYGIRSEASNTPTAPAPMICLTIPEDSFRLQTFEDTKRFLIEQCVGQRDKSEWSLDYQRQVQEVEYVGLWLVNISVPNQCEMTPILTLLDWKAIKEGLMEPEYARGHYLEVTFNSIPEDDEWPDCLGTPSESG